mgnify:CR=1 FL=1
MSETTVGEFLKAKAQNMSRWLKENGNPVDVDLGSLTPLALTALAQRLRSEHATSIANRDFDALLAEKENMPGELSMTISFVNNNPALYDKFWRYLELFSDTVK